MNRSFTQFVSIVALGLYVSLAQAEDEYKFRTIDVGQSGGCLCVVAGELQIVRGRTNFTEWTIRKTDLGWTVCSGAKREIPARFLSVDEKGQVVLTADSDAGSYWKLTRGEGRDSRFQATLQSTREMYSDWYLDFASIGEPSKLEGVKSERLGAKLAKKPSAKSRLSIWLDGP